MSSKADQLGRRAQMQKTYRYSNIRKAKSQRAEFLNPSSDDWFSELLDWLADRTLLVFGVVLVCLLLLSIACDHVLGSANASVPGSSAAITQGDSASTDKESEKRPLGKVVYSVDISPRLHTGLAEEIYLADPINIERLEWN